MFKNLSSLILIVAGMSLVFWTGTIQAETKIESPDYKANLLNENSPMAQSLSAELSSAITPPASPMALIGTASYFSNAPGSTPATGGFYVGMDANSKPLLYPIDSATNLTSYLFSEIQWSPSPNSTPGANFNTCTLNLTSLPPGPLYVNLSGSTANVMIDSQTTVITKESYPSWFANPPASYTEIRFYVDGTWYSNTSTFKDTSPYPSLQYYPNGVTITFQ